MRCPDCRQELVILEVDEVELDLCVEGHGTWFDSQELSQLFARAQERGAIGEPLPAWELELERAEGERGKRRCPRCDRALHITHFPGGGPVLDRCPRGHGLWFDPGELHELAQAGLGDDEIALAQVRAYLKEVFPREPLKGDEV